MLWEARETRFADLMESARPPVIDKFFYSRNLKSEEQIQNFLNQKLKDITDPLKIKDMSKAMERLVIANAQKEKILLYADYDMDGSPGLAMGLLVLKKMGFDVRGYQPDRHVEGYGFHFNSIKKFIDEGVSLVITIDVGITDVKTVEELARENIDVIITDHHQVSELGIPKALAVINPNRPDDESGLSYLCGTGVLFYLLMRLKKTLTEKDLLEEEIDLKEYLDLFAIATLTDMVPLIKDNRVLVNHGLLQLSKTNKIGLSQLLKDLELSDRKLGSQDVAIKFTPKLNALTRMDADLKPIDILSLDKQDLAKSLVEKVIAIHKSRVEVQATAEEILNEEIEKQKNNPVFYLADEKIHKGIMGLLATKVTEKLGVPAFVGAISEGIIYGSARLPSGFEGSVLEALKFSEFSLTRFGGHHSAAGFESLVSKSEHLSNLLKKYFLSQPLKTKKNIFDLKISFLELAQFMSWWDHLEPFGEGWGVPVFKFENVLVEKYQWLKEKHLKINVRQHNYPMSLEAILFSAPERFRSLSVGQIVTLYAEPSWNYFKGAKRMQLGIKDLGY